MRIAVACGIAFGAVALLQPAAAGPFGEKKVLTLEIARKIVTAAEAEATRHHLAGVVAVVDDGGWPILIERMDHAAYLASVELAPGKRHERQRYSRSRVRRLKMRSTTVALLRLPRAASLRCKARFQLSSMAR
jgi:hypothetical protein